MILRSLRSAKRFAQIYSTSAFLHRADGTAIYMSVSQEAITPQFTRSLFMVGHFIFSDL